MIPGEETDLNRHGHADSELEVLAEVSRYAADSNQAGLRDVHDRAFGELAAALVDGRITGPAFEEQFLKLWRLYRDNHVATSSTVDELFTEVDAYCADPELREEGDLDDAGLRAAVGAFLGDHRMG